MCYDAKIGDGRPSWNLQDAAIVSKHLGFSIDVACGGIDNLVRHHDYTLAIAEAVSGGEFSRFWLHGGHLFVDGKKMSKSMGNVFYLNDLLAEGFTAEQVRFFLIYGPYREKLNFTLEKLTETSGKLDAFRSMVKDLQQPKSENSLAEVIEVGKNVVSVFENHLNDDLDVKGAFDSLYNLVKELHENGENLSANDANSIVAALRRIDAVLQCIF